MARPEGTFKLTSNIEPRMNAPLDARLVVPVKADLYDLDHYYQGMIVGVKTGGVFQLTGVDPSLESSWSSVGGDSGSMLEPRIDAIENGMADIKHTITAVDVESIFNNEFENPTSSLGEGYAVGVYIRESGTAYSADWFSKTDGGDAITPNEKDVYIVLSDGDYHWHLYKYTNSVFRHVGDAESAVSEWFYTTEPTTTTTLPELSPNTINGKWDVTSFKNGITLDRTDSYTGTKDNVNFTKTLGAIRCNKSGEKFVFDFRYDINTDIVANRRGIFIRSNGSVLKTMPRTNGTITQYTEEIIAIDAMVGKDIAVFYGKCTSSDQNTNRTWLYGGTIKRYESVEYYRYVSNSKLNMNALVREIARSTRENTKGDDDSDVGSVATKTDLYNLSNTYRGMIVYVIDEDQYYKLVNDLPAYEASWQVYQPESLVEITEAEIDAMFS